MSFRLLYFHCRLTMLREATRIIEFLDQTDYSQYTTLMVASLRTHITEEVKENRQAVSRLIDRCRLYELKRLEVE